MRFVILMFFVLAMKTSLCRFQNLPGTYFVGRAFVALGRGDLPDRPALGFEPQTAPALLLKKTL
jgi:hypothetical protein